MDSVQGEECCGRDVEKHQASQHSSSSASPRASVRVRAGAVRGDFALGIAPKCGSHQVCSPVFWPLLLPVGMHFPSPLVWL